MVIGIISTVVSLAVMTGWLLRYLAKVEDELRKEWE